MPNGFVYISVYLVIKVWSFRRIFKSLPTYHKSLKKDTSQLVLLLGLANLFEGRVCAPPEFGNHEKTGLDGNLLV